MPAGRILIADDDPVTRMDLRGMLEAIGYTVVGEAGDGEEACLLARNLRPDLIILDIMMPKCSGLEAAATISRERLGPVMMLTAYSDAPMIEDANRAGVLAWLVKPFRQQELQPSIEMAVARYREMLALTGALEVTQQESETERLAARARRILVHSHAITDQEAGRRLQAQALASGKELRIVAEAVIMASELHP